MIRPRAARRALAARKLVEERFSHVAMMTRLLDLYTEVMDAASGRHAVRRMTRPAPLVILQLVANRWWTGSADPVIQLSRGLEARGHRVLLGLIPGDRFEAKAREAGLVPLGGLSLDAKRAPLACVTDIARLRRLVRSGTRRRRPHASLPRPLAGAPLPGARGPRSELSQRARRGPSLAGPGALPAERCAHRGQRRGRGAMPRGSGAGRANRSRRRRDRRRALQRIRRRRGDPEGVRAGLRAGGGLGRASRAAPRP